MQPLSGIRKRGIIMSSIAKKEIYQILSECDGDVGLYVEDCQTGEVFTVNAEESFPSASVIKVPMLAVLLKDARDGLVELDTPREIAEENRVGGSGIICDLDRRFTPTLRDMAKLMIVLSDNAATNEIMDVIGMERFNRFWADWGCSATKLMRKMMDQEAIKQGRNNYTSAADMGRMLSAAAKNELIDAEISKEMFDIMAAQKLQTRLPLLLPLTGGYGPDGQVPEGKVLVAHKTGSVSGICHDAGIFELHGHRRYVVAMLTRGFAKASDATTAINRVSLAVYNGFAQA